MKQDPVLDEEKITTDPLKGPEETNIDWEAQIAEANNQVDIANNKYLRALADYQNLSRQTEAWKVEFVQYANVSLIVKLIEVLDDLEKAQENLKNDGLALVVNKFQKVLESEGLEVINLDGKEYDPNLAEVISMEPGEKDNIIMKVLQKGYRLKDKVVRPGKVIVSKKE